MRTMFQMPDGRWLLKCRLCGRRTATKHDTARAAHDEWRAHVSGDRHLELLHEVDHPSETEMILVSSLPGFASGSYSARRTKRAVDQVDPPT